VAIDQTGTQGPAETATSGVASENSPSGATGAQDPAAPQANTGVAGIAGDWTSYAFYFFSYDDAVVRDSDRDKSADIASYLRRNPSLELGLDGSMDPNGTDPRDQGLRDRRVDAVRASLVAAGVPAGRIKIGAFGDAQTRRDRRVEVLFSPNG
jgi:outer membrane protein OmpA-like peptidoglycan-associated protein